MIWLRQQGRFDICDSSLQDLIVMKERWLGLFGGHSHHGSWTISWRRVVNYFGTTAHIETAHTNTSIATSMMAR
jgi:hypothetical protein